MITSKQRATLRKLANGIPAILQIGKGGICDNFLKQVDDALEARELIKVTVLETAMMDTKVVCGYVAEKVKAEPVQAIGSKFVIYRESKEHKTIEI